MAPVERSTSTKLPGSLEPVRDLQREVATVRREAAVRAAELEHRNDAAAQKHVTAGCDFRHVQSATRARADSLPRDAVRVDRDQEEAVRSTIGRGIGAADPERQCITRCRLRARSRRGRAATACGAVRSDDGVGPTDDRHDVAFVHVPPHARLDAGEHGCVVAVGDVGRRRRAPPDCFRQRRTARRRVPKRRVPRRSAGCVECRPFPSPRRRGGPGCRCRARTGCRARATCRGRRRERSSGRIGVRRVGVFALGDRNRPTRCRRPADRRCFGSRSPTRRRSRRRAAAIASRIRRRFLGERAFALVGLRLDPPARSEPARP